MLDLANDCFRFVTGYFEIISTSSPHIYHSALVVAPENSIVRKLYEPHTHPFIRVVCGAPMSWDASIAATTRSSKLETAVWSPCDRFIAITWKHARMVDVLDSTTLQQLQTLESPQDIPTDSRTLIFSPGSHILTCSSVGRNFPSSIELFVVSWDLQTGGITSVIKWEGPMWDDTRPYPLIYLANGKMVGGSPSCRESTVAGACICTCDVTSGVLMHSHLANSPDPLPADIWTHGETLWFTSTGARTITIWEVEFTPSATLTEVKTIPSPDCLDHEYMVVQLLPTPCRLALFSEYQVLVWDVQNSRYLLKCADAKFLPIASFSSNGHFFACSTTKSEIYLWKETPNGYTLHRIIPSSAKYLCPLLAQNGKSIVGFGGCVIQLWHTDGFIAPSSTLAQASQCTEAFIMEFSPDGMLAVVAVERGKTVTILNIKSGIPQLIINAGTDICGLRVTGNTIVVLGGWEVIAWDLPVGDCVPGAQLGPEDSSWTAKMQYHAFGSPSPARASISPDFHYTAFFCSGEMLIGNTSTGEYLQQRHESGCALRFSPDGHNLWSLDQSGEAKVWKIGDGQNVLELSELTVSVKHPPEGYHWGSTHGYQVTDDWWILGPDRKRLLMLPPPWQSYPVHRVWNGQFLALLHGGLSEPVILELEAN